MGHYLLEHLLVVGIHVAKQVRKEGTDHNSLLDEQIHIQFLRRLFDQLLLDSCLAEDLLDHWTALGLAWLPLCKPNRLLAPNFKGKLWVVFDGHDLRLA